MENSRQKFHLRSKNFVTFDSAYSIYPMAFSSSTFSLPYRHPRIAVGSLIEEVNNCVDILAFDEDTLTLKPVPDLCFELPYPPTKLMFHPNPSAFLKSNDILASSGDHLCLWEVSDTSVEPPFTLSKDNPGEYFAPLTSFDWNEVEPRRIGTSSIDSSCTIWDVEKGVVESELIVHEKEVYDIAWGEAAIFASASADGSVRIFDLRDKKHLMVVYRSPKSNTPLRLAWNKQDLRYMATILTDSNKIVILDVRSRAMPVAELEGHQASVNAIAWAPQSRRHICSAGDDGQALIWELPTVAGPNKIAHMSSYSAEAEINRIHWSAAQCDWISIAFSNKLQLLRV